MLTIEVRYPSPVSCERPAFCNFVPTPTDIRRHDPVPRRSVVYGYVGDSTRKPPAASEAPGVYRTFVVVDPTLLGWRSSLAPWSFSGLEGSPCVVGVSSILVVVYPPMEMVDRRHQ